MLSCKEVTQLVASDELHQAGWWRRMSVRIQLLMCHNCLRYVAQLRAIGTAARDLWQLSIPEAERLGDLEHAILRTSGIVGADRDEGDKES